MEEETASEIREIVEGIVQALDLGTAPTSYVAAYRDLDPLAQGQVQQRLALRVPDREALWRLLEGNREEGGGDGETVLAADNFYPPTAPEKRRPSTLGAIDKFLDTYGHGNDPGETQLLERLIFNPPAADYMASMEHAQEAPAAVDPIERFIATHPEGGEDVLEVPELAESAPSAMPEAKTTPKSRKGAKKHRKTTPGPGFRDLRFGATLTESLARIYIKQKRYGQAYEIIERLNLANSEKSSYFAVQMRFLRKLMLIESYTKGSEGNSQDANQ